MNLRLSYLISGQIIISCGQSCGLCSQADTWPDTWDDHQPPTFSSFKWFHVCNSHYYTYL